MAAAANGGGSGDYIPLSHGLMVATLAIANDTVVNVNVAFKDLWLEDKDKVTRTCKSSMTR